MSVAKLTNDTKRDTNTTETVTTSDNASSPTTATVTTRDTNVSDSNDNNGSMATTTNGGGVAASAHFYPILPYSFKAVVDMTGWVHSKSLLRRSSCHRPSLSYPIISYHIMHGGRLSINQ
jgi:hypothetical protein